MIKNTLNINIKDTFNKELPVDPETQNRTREVHNSCFSLVKPLPVENPSLISTSPEMLDALGIDKSHADSKQFLSIFSGREIVEDTNPYAMCYGGHQFGNWAGQLGDGRAINLFEVHHNNQQWALQLKGSGQTPYSRHADGLAVLRSSIREYLCSEAMYHLGVPTTRALSLVLSGEEVLRDIMYDGNPAHEKGAIVCRVAPSFIRFGNFQILASRKDTKTLKQLLDYTIKHFFPDIKSLNAKGYIEFFQSIANKTVDMITHWQRVGFVHGVMNTDNMSILGLTIDYGPYGWLEGFDPNWTPNTTDADFHRYAFGNQPKISLWNLVQLGNALYPLIGDVEPLNAILKNYSMELDIALMQMTQTKLGLSVMIDGDMELIHQMESVLQLSETDMTIFYRNLSNHNKDYEISDTTDSDILKVIKEAFYAPEEIKNDIQAQWVEWMKSYTLRLQQDPKSDEERKKAMDQTNPKYVLRNYMSQLAIEDADKGDYALLEELFDMLKTPYDEQPENEKWFAKRPEWARHKVGCSALSCSS